jgi:hypothetical protein
MSAPMFFNAVDVGNHLSKLKAAAGGADFWWKSAIKIEWESPRAGGNGTKWINVSYVNEAGTESRLNLRILGERHSGNIMPDDAEELARYVATMKLKDGARQPKVRDRKAALQFAKWREQVKTINNDGINPVLNEKGEPIYPGDDKMSPYFKVAALVNEAFQAEAGLRVDRGREYFNLVAEHKKNKATFAQILEAANAAGVQRAPVSMFMSADEVTKLKAGIPVDQHAALMKGIEPVKVTKVAQLIQDTISGESTTNPGAALLNPLARITLNFEAGQLAVHDKGRPYISEGKQRYELATTPDPRDATKKIPCSDKNIHLILQSGSIVDGIVNMNAVCCSSMGVSLPTKAQLLVISRPVKAAVTFDDLYEPGEPLVGASEAAGVAEGGAAAAAAAAADPAPEPDADAGLDETLAGLAG